MKFRDVLMLINMVLFLILGATILMRSPGQKASWPAYLMGFGFLFAGLYRLYLVYSIRKSQT